MRGIEGKIEAIRFARTRQIPYFGICLGMQCAVIEFARSILGLEEANSTEFDKTTDHPVIALMETQRACSSSGVRCGWARGRASSNPDSLARRAYVAEQISERHRHRYEFNNDYRKAFGQHGLIPSGTSPDGVIVEIIELRNHPWFLAVQFHPEFQSKPTQRIRSSATSSVPRSSAEGQAAHEGENCRHTVRGEQVRTMDSSPDRLTPTPLNKLIRDARRLVIIHPLPLRERAGEGRERHPPRRLVVPRPPLPNPLPRLERER